MTRSAPGASEEVTRNALPPFERYGVILERMPFGRPPPEPRPQPPPPEPESPMIEAFIKRHRLCALTRTDQGIGVGFIDSAQNPPKPYFILVGESLDGYEVVSADFDRETVTIRKDHEIFTITLDGQVTPSEAAAQQQAAASASPAAVVQRRRPDLSRGRPSRAGEGEADRESYIELLRQRREAERQRQAEDAQQQRQQVERLTGEALQRHLREYNMELIRSGGQSGPPLPIALTPEEDAQLVAEGVLPPPDEEAPDVP